MAKFIAVVLACGIYQNTNHVCIEWTDQAWHSTRAQCIARGKEIVKKIETLTWYASVKLDKAPVPKCKELP